MADYGKAIELDPNNITAFRKRADTYVAMQRFKDAIPDLEAASKLKPDDPDIMQNLMFVRAKAAPPPPPKPVVAAPSPTPVPPPEGMSMPMKVGIGGGVLVLSRDHRRDGDAG